MSFWCYGLNYRETPVEVRERFAVAEKAQGQKARALVEELEDVGLVGSVLLSTCNRVEVHGSLREGLDEAGIEKVRDGVERVLGVGSEGSEEGLGQAVFDEYRGASAVRHLFEVASGLDSMVLGETEIFGQLKEAYRQAHAEAAVDKPMHRVWQRCFQVGKLVRNKTEIQKGSTSVGSVAVDLAEKIFGKLKQCQVMLLGAGEMARVTAQSLASRGARSLFVSNRSWDKAVELASEIEGEAIRFDDWQQRMVGMDVVIASTSAPHALLLKEEVAAVMEKRPQRPLFLIDIAVPRDVDAAVQEVDGVYVYDMDAMESIAEEGRRKRELQVALCRTMIDGQLRKYGYL